MELNLTRLWENISFPFAVLIEKIRDLIDRITHRRAVSRRLGKSISPQEKRLRLVKISRIIAIIALGVLLLGMVVFFVMFAYYSRDLPKPGEIIRREGFSTKIYDRNGKLLYDLFNTERRNPIKIEDVPDNLKKATIAIEDKDFLKHEGFDILTLLRIPYNFIIRRRIVGGSTLTQQLVKNVLLTSERRVSRKFKELVLSIQIERKFTKDQILEMYLNEAPYGGTAWGVGTAAEIYFNKNVSDLTLIESAFLAGLPQRPSAYSPYSGKQDESGEMLWKMRTKAVLRRMYEDNYITAEEAEQALKDLDNLQFIKSSVEIKAPHFVFYVRDKLEEMFGADLVERGGLSVTTTLDLDMQDKAQEIVKEEVEKITKFNINNGAAVVMNPKTGEIIAMVGSKDYFDNENDGQFNVAADGLRQPGSSIKPVTYLAMLQRGYTPASMIIDAETIFVPNGQSKRYEPKNYDGKFRGPVSLRVALASSLNIPAVKSLAVVGVENFLNLAYEMGFVTLEPTAENLKNFGLALTLGGGEVHLIDTVSAYSSFATGGIKVEPVSILKVQDSDGKVLYEYKQLEGKRIFSKEEAFLINHILSDNSARTPAFGSNSALHVNANVAVKTGTTNDMKDNWTIGWSQEVIVGTWVGNNNNDAMSYVASGITGASPIWRSIILAAFEKGYKSPDWEIPEGIEQVDVDVISGYDQHDDFPSKKEYIIKGTLPSPPDPIHLMMKVCKGENKLATEAKIASGDYDKKEKIVLREDDPVSEDGENRWQQGIDAWLEAQVDERFKIPTEYCGESEDISVKLRKPKDKETFSGEEIEVEINAGSDDGIERIELYVDGDKKKTIDNESSYKGKITLSKGQHELYAKAKSKSGKEAKSSTVRIGTGGEDWEEPEPTKKPDPTDTPKPTAKATPTVTLTPTP